MLELGPMVLKTPLAGSFVTLAPLAETHREGLRAACAADPDIWRRIYPFSMIGDRFDPGFEQLLADHRGGAKAVFAVLQGEDVIGMTSYISPSAEHRSVEIGGTYYRPDARGGPVNPEAKRLLLERAFGGGFQRVVFRVDAINERSRAAVLKLGAVFEGINRQDRVTWTGRVRDTCVFSILAAEWPAVRAGLEARLAAFARA